MYQIDNDTASTTLPVPKPLGIPGFFTAGTVGGEAATIVEADWLNQVQQELLAILSAAGIAPSKTVNSQVIQAILWLIANNTRQRLTGPLDLYVNVATGSDTNNGLTPQTPFATPQHAYDYIMRQIDMGGQSITVHMAAGAYGQLVCDGAPVGATGAGVTFLGDENQPDNVLINNTTGDSVYCSNGAIVTLRGFKIQSSGSIVPNISTCNGIHSSNGAYVMFYHCDFGTCANNHLQVSGPATLSSAGQPYTISGSARAHLGGGYSGGVIGSMLSTVTINNNPNFSIGFCWVDSGATMLVYQMVFNGTATGPHANVQSNAILWTGGQGVDSGYLPGNAPSTVTTGGVVV